MALKERLQKKKLVMELYPDEECVVEGCDNMAVGEVDVCEKHGGERVIEKNLLAPKDVPTALLKAVKYDKGIHPMGFISYSKKGLSAVEIAAEFGVSMKTLKKWDETFEEFHEAFEVGAALHEAWYIQKGKDNLDNMRYNTTLYKYLTGNKLGWAEKTESKNLNVHAGVLVVPQQVTEAEWEEVHD